MSKGPLVVLVGAPGAGKSTVGMEVARLLGLPFNDSDRLIEDQVGKCVADIFIEDGEVAFREIERETIARQLQEGTGVLSLGGGAVLDAGTRQLLRGRTVVWLKVGIADASRRVGLTASRPLLLGNVRGTLIALLEQRTPLYDEVATIRVETDGVDVDEVSRQVAALVAELVPGDTR